MEYFRDPQNRIQADMAYRLGIIAKQYSSLSLPEANTFTSTLDICILQNLLTNCITLLDAMSKSERRKCYLTEDLAKRNANLWGLNKNMIITNTFHTTEYSNIKMVFRSGINTGFRGSNF